MIDHATVFQTLLKLHESPHDPLAHGLPKDYDLIEPFRCRAQSIADSHRLIPGPIAVPGRPMPYVYVGLMDGPRLCARAAFRDATLSGYIAFSTDAILVIHDLFYRSLSHPEVLPEIGDPSLERRDDVFHSQGISDSYDEILAARRPGGGRLEQVQPKCPVRRSYALRLATIALDFLVLHELCHVRHGHCQLANDLGWPFIPELWLDARQADFKPSDYLTAQAMEMDADAFPSIRSFVDHCGKPEERNWKATEALSFRKKADCVIDPLIVATFDWSFAITCLFWCFRIEFDPATANEWTHYPAPLRARNAAATIATLLLERFNDPEAAKRFSKAYSDAAGAVVKAHRHLGRRFLPAELPLLADPYTPLKSHFNVVKAEWTRIRPRLLNYSYVTNLAP